jgi:hypothetical protein
MAQDPDRRASTAPGVGRSASKKRLDAVVKFGLAVFAGSFLLIWGGMFLTRPDRSIPPYSIGSQQGTVVAVHVPAWTSDSRIETLIQRFRRIGREDRDFGRMKIHPTTPDDPRGRYRLIRVYIFTLDAWTEPDVLRRYLSGGDSPADRDLREGFEKAVRGYYRLEDTGGRLEEEGRIGPMPHAAASPANAAYSRLLFQGPIEMGESNVGANTALGERMPQRPARRGGQDATPD